MSKTNLLVEIIKRKITKVTRTIMMKELTSKKRNRNSPRGAVNFKNQKLNPILKRRQRTSQDKCTTTSRPLTLSAITINGREPSSIGRKLIIINNWRVSPVPETSVIMMGWIHIGIEWKIRIQGI